MKITFKSNKPLKQLLKQKTPPKVGRPVNHLSEDDLFVLIEHARSGTPMDKIALYLDCGESKLWKTLLQNGMIRKLYDKAVGQANKDVAGALINKALSGDKDGKGNVLAQQFFLKCRAKWSGDLEGVLAERIRDRDDKIISILTRHIKDPILLEAIASALAGMPTDEPPDGYGEAEGD